MSKWLGFFLRVFLIKYHVVYVQIQETVDPADPQNKTAEATFRILLNKFHLSCLQLGIKV